jgi:hypothetical protein
MNIGNGPPGLNPLDIQWDIPKDGICLLELFEGISFGYVTMSQLVANVSYMRLSTFPTKQHHITKGARFDQDWAN